jgi:hypothetical protein
MPSSRKTQRNRLELLAQNRFFRLTGAERALIRSASAGEMTNYLPKVKHRHASGFTAPVSSGEGSGIRAMLIRWLCLSSDAKTRVLGIQVSAATILGQLDLTFADIPFELVFRRCTFERPLILKCAHLLALDLTDCRLKSVQAFEADVKTYLSLDQAYVEGEVDLVGTRIGGDLSCRSAHFSNQAGGIALRGDRAVVAGSVFLNNDFKAQGEVGFLTATSGVILNATAPSFSIPIGLRSMLIISASLEI